MKFSIHSLLARYGDCLWIEYGDDTQTHRILIDGGTAGTKSEIKKRLNDLPEEERHFELLVVTHIDRDHIEGILSLLEEDSLGFTVDDFWFNSWDHLPKNEDETFGAVQGERLTAAIRRHGLNWNEAFDKKAVVIPESGNLPEIHLAGGMVLTLLSPLISNLKDLRPKWENEVRIAGLVPGFGAQIQLEAEDDDEVFGAQPDVNELNLMDFKEDTSEANGSSIAFLAEFDGKTVLFSGDAFPGVVLESLSKIYGHKAKIDLLKVSHHASAHNTSPELIEKLDCSCYLISTNGSIFHHPKAETISRIIKRGGENVELLFNYRSEDNKIWDSRTLKAKYKYKTVYPANEEEGISILL